MMTLFETSLAASDTIAPTALERLQLLVARRADAIARRLGGRPEHQRTIWLRAELEVFEAEERSGLPGLPSSG
jgi:DNA-directed RNA polymerase specialized sigma24 family protein